MSFNTVNPYQQFIDSTGKVRVNGIATFFTNTTTTKASIFSDEALSVAQNNPYTLNANGQIIGDVKYSGLLTLQVSNSDGSDVIRTDNVATIGDQTTIVEILGSVAGTNTITATGTPTITSLVDLTVYSFTAANAITGAVTLQIDATSAKSVLKYHDQPLISGDIEANQAVSVIYNSTDDVFELISSTLNPQIQSITATVAASALTLGLNPTSMYFRKTPLTDGTPNVRSNASLSLVVPSGATLGTTDAVESRLILLAIDNAGTIELAVTNGAGLNESTLITTIAIDATADSKGSIYSITARTSVPFRIVGFIDSTQATAGTWATSPTVIQGAGINLRDGVVLNHIRAGNIQIPDGELSLTSINITSVVTEITWESVGATGSGADNIWTAMNNLPANATVLLAGLRAEVTPNSASGAEMLVYTTHGDDATPAASDNNNLTAHIVVDQDAAITGSSKYFHTIMIPLGVANNDFQIFWNQISSGTNSVVLFYKGFMTD